jgi:hypothetical protein
LRLLLAKLTTQKDGQPVRRWVAGRADRINEIDPILAGVSPEAAVAVVQKGGRVLLGGHNGADWEIQAWALDRVAEVDPTVAVAVLNSNRQDILARLSNLQGIDCEELPAFLRTAERLVPGVLRELFREVDPATATEKWPPHLSDRRREVRRGARGLLTLIREHGESGLKGFADRLLERPVRQQRRSSQSDGA